jgi:hypothetical protein
MKEVSFDVMCIDSDGVGSWEEVILDSVHDDLMFGTIRRIGKRVKFWDSSDDSEDDYTGLII